MEQKGRGNQQLSTVKETYCPEICLWWWSSPMEGNLRLSQGGFPEADGSPEKSCRTQASLHRRRESS